MKMDIKNIDKKYIIIGACTLVVVLIGFVVYIFKSKTPVEESSFFSSFVSSSAPTTSMVLTEKIETEPVVTEPPMFERAAQLYQLNSDTVGYIKINNTMVDYPVVQIPGNSEIGNSYYIDHDFDRNPAKKGAIFLDYRAYFGPDENLHSDNLVIYGHNMRNDTMFGSLRHYRQDYSFYEKNSIIELSSNYKDYKYEIFGFFIVSGSSTSDFKYWNYINFANEEEFNQFVNQVKRRSLVKIDADVKYGDKLVTLSTCYADEDNSRFVIVGRRLSDEEASMT
ncbi:MAG: class B sortase [Clostridiales bacterium]|jgi:sortase B|nr:class B sortase [Clostridiales bacterium]